MEYHIAQQPESIRVRKGLLEQRVGGLFPWKKRFCQVVYKGPSAYFCCAT